MRMRYYLAVALIGALGLVGCASSEGPQGSTGAQGPEGPAPDVSIEVETAGENCEFGGVRVTIGNEDPFFVCNGEDGSPGAPGNDGDHGDKGDKGDEGDDGITPTITVEEIEETDTEHDCDAGGFVVTVDPNDGTDPTVEYLCHGEQGEQGEPGETGAATGITIVEFDGGDEGDNCVDTGGLKITTTSLDVDGNDVTDDYFVCHGAEGDAGTSPTVSVRPADTTECDDMGGTVLTVDGTDYEICDGVDGDAGTTPVINVTELDAGTGDHGCQQAGGYLVTINDSEIELCHGEKGDKGEPGAGGIDVVEFDAGERGEECEDTGGVEIILSPVDPNDPSTYFYVCHGADGDDGAAGTVVTARDATEQECEFGGVVVSVEEVDYTVCNGADGETGDDGETPMITVSQLFADTGDHGCQAAGGYAITFETSTDSTTIELCHGEGVEPEPIEIGWCNIQSPLTVNQDGWGSTDVYSQVYIEGVTGAQAAGEERPDEIVAQLGYGAVGSTDYENWAWFDAERNTAFAPQAGRENNDEYFAALAYLWPGSYDYVFRYSGDFGETWTTCFAEGGNAGLATITNPGVVAFWDFEGETTDVTGGIGTITHGSGGPGTYPGGYNSDDAWSFTEWDLTPLDGTGEQNSTLAEVDLDSTAYFEISVDFTGLTNVEFSFVGNRSGTGPKQFALAYSMDGVDFIVLSETDVPTTGWETYEFNLTDLVSGFANASDVRLRIYGFDAGTSGGTWRIDDVTLVSP